MVRMSPGRVYFCVTLRTACGTGIVRRFQGFGSSGVGGYQKQGQASEAVAYSRQDKVPVTNDFVPHFAEGEGNGFRQ